jgi:nucleotide-binding universal stress UspA family protein
MFKPRLHLLHTGKDLNHLPEDKALNLLALENLFSSFTPVLQVEVADDPEVGIINYVKEKQATLLAILPRKHGPLYHLLNKSVTHRLAFHTPVPMLVLKEF